MMRCRKQYVNRSRLRRCDLNVSTLFFFQFCFEILPLSFDTSRKGGASSRARL